MVLLASHWDRASCQAMAGAEPQGWGGDAGQGLILFQSTTGKGSELYRHTGTGGGERQRWGHLVKDSHVQVRAKAPEEASGKPPVGGKSSSLDPCRRNPIQFGHKGPVALLGSNHRSDPPSTILHACQTSSIHTILKKPVAEACTLPGNGVKESWDMASGASWVQCKALPQIRPAGTYATTEGGGASLQAPRRRNKQGSGRRWLAVCYGSPREGPGSRRRGCRTLMRRFPWGLVRNQFGSDSNVAGSGCRRC